MKLSPRELRQVEAARHALKLVPVNSPASTIVEPLRLCMPVAAALLSLIRPGADDALVSQPVDLPTEIFESWLRMPPDQLQLTLDPVLSSSAGRLWRDSETFHPAQREQLDVLRELEGAGLGEGAAYKLLERPIQVMLALLAGQGERIPERAQEILSALHEHLEEAVLRIRLPLVARESIDAQIMAEQSLGYVCLSQSGHMIEANRRACHLVERYRDAAGIRGLRGAVEDFMVRARKAARAGQPWQLRSDGPPSSLYVYAHHLAKETHSLSEDTILLQMREVLDPPVDVDVLAAFKTLTNRERQVALLLIRTASSLKQIAAQLDSNSKTVRTHVQHIYTKLGVSSRAELMLRYNK